VIHLHCLEEQRGLDRKSVRFGLLIDPLEMTGSFLAMSQYPVFKVQAAADSLHILRFFPPRATEPFSAARRYITHSSLHCQHRFETFFEPLWEALSRRNLGANRKPPDQPGGTATRCFRPIGTAASQLWPRLPKLRFQHALRSLIVPVVR
jgi:hypothetical protein